MEKGKNPKPKKEVIAKLKGELEIIKEEIRNDVSVPVVASFGFIIALIWRDAIQAGINEFLSRAGLLEKAYVYQIISAIIVTIAVIIIMVLVTKFSRVKRKKMIEKKKKDKKEDIKKKI